MFRGFSMLPSAFKPLTKALQEASDQRLGGRSCCRRVELPPNIDLHHLIERDAILAPIVERGRAGGGMRRQLPRLLQRAAVLEVGGDAVPRKVWLHTYVVMPAPTARGCARARHR